MKSILKLVAISLLITATLRCTAPAPKPPTAPAPTSQQAATSDRVIAWQQDLDALMTELARRHKNAFFHTSREDFQKAGNALRSRIDSLADHQVIVEFMKLVALLGDGHTSVEFSAAKPPFHAYPLTFLSFSDGIFVAAAPEQYRELVGCKLLHINDISADEAARRVSTVFPYENESWRAQALRRFMSIAEVLNTVNIIPDMNRAAFALKNPDGREFTIELAPLAPGVKLQWVTAWDSIKDSLPISRLQRPEWYWFEQLPESSIIYCRYDRCADQTGKPVSAFSKELLDFIQQRDTSQLIIDLRNNGGGNSALLDPLIDDLAKLPKSKLDRTVVLIGRATFSSGQLNANSIRNKLHATVIGEPTGQKPNAYGEVRSFNLPHSGLAVSYSTKYFKTDPADPPSMMPDISVDLTAADFFSTRDAAFEATLKLLNQPKSS